MSYVNHGLFAGNGMNSKNNEVVQFGSLSPTSGKL